MIVASILLAFAIDRGYEGFKQTQEETAILSGREAELTASGADLQRHTWWYERWESSIAEIRTYLHEDPERVSETAPEIISALRWLYAVPTFDPSTATLDVIEASGRGTVVTDHELRTLIAQWRVHAEDALGQQQVLQRSRESSLWPLFVELNVEAPRAGRTIEILGRVATVDQLRASDLSTVLTLYGMLAEISGGDSQQVLDATDAVLDRLDTLAL